MENGFPSESHVFKNPLPPDTQDVITTAGALCIQVKMITFGYVSIPKETCRVIERRIQILQPRTFQLMKPTRLMIALEILWRVSTTLWVYILSTTSKLFRCGELHRGSSTEGLDWECSTESSTRGLDWGARLGGSFRVSTLHELDWFTRGSDAAFSSLPRRLQRWGLWCGGSGGIHYPLATDLAGGRSPNVEGDHWSGVAGKTVVTQTHRLTTPHSLDLFGVDLDRG